MSDLHAIRDGLQDFLVDRAALPPAADEETDLIDSGFLDSLVLVDLVLHIQRAFGVELRPADMTPANFRTIAQLASLVYRRSRADQVDAA